VQVENPAMRPLTRRLALTIALSIWTALPSVQVCRMTGVGCALACDEQAPKRGARVAASTCPAGMTPAACATTCSRKPEPMRIAGHSARAAATTCPASDPQQDPISGDRAWCVQPSAPAVQVHSASISFPLAPLWFAAITDPSVLQQPLRAMGDWARRISPAPPSADHRTPPQSRAPPVWVGDLL
jgi:hypothetical protein